MRLVSWNVNGIRSILNKGFLDWLSETSPDVICLQETKISEHDLEQHVPCFSGYSSYWHSAERSGYSGVAILTKQEPHNLTHGIGSPEFDCEGRALTAEFDRFFLVNVYAPNSQIGYTRLPFRLAWEEALRTHLATLLPQKPVILCGDLNVAHTSLDVGITDAAEFPGCSSEERAAFQTLLDLGFIDTFRTLHPETRSYSWWAYANDARGWNLGVRFDYILSSSSLHTDLRDASTHRDVPGSDHGPVSAEFNFPLGGKQLQATPVSPTGQFGFAL